MSGQRACRATDSARVVLLSGQAAVVRPFKVNVAD